MRPGMKVPKASDSIQGLLYNLRYVLVGEPFLPDEIQKRRGLRTLLLITLDYFLVRITEEVLKEPWPPSHSLTALAATSETLQFAKD